MMLDYIQKLIIMHIFFALFEDPDNAQEQVLWIQCDACDMYCHQVCVRASWPPLLRPAEDDIFWHCLSCVAVNTM